MTIAEAVLSDIAFFGFRPDYDEETEEEIEDLLWLGEPVTDWNAVFAFWNEF